MHAGTRKPVRQSAYRIGLTMPANADADAQRVMELLSHLTRQGPLPHHILRSIQALRSEAERVSGPSSGLSTLINSILATAEANRAGGGGGGAAGIPYRRLSHGYGGPDDSSDDENKMTDEDDDDGEDGDGAPAGGAPGDRQEQLMYDDDGDDDGDGLEDDDMGDLGGPRAEPLLLLNRALDEPHDERWGPGAAGEGGEQAAMQRRHEALQRLVRSARFPSAAPSRVVGGDAGHDEMLRRGPPPVSFLQAGQVFSGVQRLSAPGGGAPPSQPSSEWKLVLRIHHCEWDKGTLSGVMEAQQPSSTWARRTPPPTIVTFWEAEVVDNLHHTFCTDKWGSNMDVDLEHWTRFGEHAFTERMRLQVMMPGPHRGRCSELESHPWVFLRLKEHAFVSSSSESSGLTITGFYFMMVERATGHVQGLYHASDSTPFQRLELKPVTQNGGMQFGAVAFA